MGQKYTLTIKDAYNDGLARPGYITALLDGNYLSDDNNVVVNNSYKYYADTNIQIDLTDDVNIPQYIKNKLKEANDVLETILPKLTKLKDKETKNGCLDIDDTNMKTFLANLKTDLLKLRIKELNTHSTNNNTKMNC